MPVNATVLFGKPQCEIASLIAEKLTLSKATSIVTGFATPGGVRAIASAIEDAPENIATIVIGAATYPGFQALDDLLDAGVPSDRLYVHLGHTSPSGTPKNPFIRFHPMLHSKIYYMELQDSHACAFIGSHNMTSYALGGFNAEAAVLLEGRATSVEFENVRKHISTLRDQAARYLPGMKEAFAWWTREFIDGMRAEVGIPNDWQIVRTILVFATSATGDRPKVGDAIYFEIPGGIQQIESFKTEVHLFLLESLPANPWDAIHDALSARAQYKCTTLGADNKQGNVEVEANWRIDGDRPVLTRVPTKRIRPNPSAGKQQVRAEVKEESLDSFEYSFDLDKALWDPVFSADPPLRVDTGIASDDFRNEVRGKRSVEAWRLVTSLKARHGGQEKDAAALRLARPESGSFMLVSLRRRRPK